MGIGFPLLLAHRYSSYNSGGWAGTFTQNSCHKNKWWAYRMGNGCPDAAWEVSVAQTEAKRDLSPTFTSLSLQLALGEPRSLAVAMGSVTAMAPVRAPACACARRATGVPSAPSVEMATMKRLATTATWYVRVCRVPVLGWVADGPRRGKLCCPLLASCLF